MCFSVLFFNISLKAKSMAKGQGDSNAAHRCAFAAGFRSLILNFD